MISCLAQGLVPGPARALVLVLGRLSAEPSDCRIPSSSRHRGAVGLASCGPSVEASRDWESQRELTVDRDCSRRIGHNSRYYSIDDTTDC